nr:PSD1 and planctomycete cytochrome C domain-containing protein [Prosthecobacter dejongeii]
MQERCYACHGALKQKAGLRIDTVALMKKGGDEGNAVARDHALILERVTTQDLHERMPPEGEGAALTAQQVELLQSWILAGAPGPVDEEPEMDPGQHWAYHLPLSAGASLDALISERLRSLDIKPQASASPEIWLRRVYLDLIGLPPTPSQIEAFIQQDKPGGAARMKVVDQLLASPQYGERWGRHFMDIWRYSDWYGLGNQLRHSQKHLWHWRDWIIESLNADKGYDEMIIQMLAADELAPDDRDNLRATGFLARSYYLFNRTTWLDETVEHTCRSFLGLTMQCVKCHDHKYDPIEHGEYYRLRAVFEPMHVRLDPWPGEIDLERNGLPRVFDLHLDRPTYRHVRGDEKNEDRSVVQRPGVPKILGGSQYQPVSQALPINSVRPALLPFVLQDHLSQANLELVGATRNMKSAKPAFKILAEKTLAVAEARPVMLRAVHAAESSPTNKKLAAEAALADANFQLAIAEQFLIKAENDPSLIHKDNQKKTAAMKRLDAARAELKKAQERVANPGVVYAPIHATLKAQEGPDDPKNKEVQTYPESSSGRRLALGRWIASPQNPLTARVLVNHVWLRHFGSALVADVSDFGRRSSKPLHQDVLDTLAVRLMDRGWSLKQLHREMVLSELYARSSSSVGVAAKTVEKDPDNTCYWRMNPRRMESQVIRDSLLSLAGKLDFSQGGATLDPVTMETSCRRSLYFNQTADTEHRFLAMFDNANVLDCYRREESIVPQQALALANSQLSHDCATALMQKLAGLDDRDFIREAFVRVLGRQPDDGEQKTCLESLSSLRRELFLQALFNHNDFVTLR